MRSPNERLRIVTTGLIGCLPLAGLTYHYLQYVLGLQALDHDVLYLEDTGMWAYDPSIDSMIEDSSKAVAYLSGVMSEHDMDGRWAFIDLRDQVHGIEPTALEDFLRSADLFVHVTGSGLMRDRYLEIERRAYIDTDPGFIQMRAANGSDWDIDHLQKHTVYFTFAQNLGKPKCNIPTLDLKWHPTLQPLHLPLWSFDPPPSDASPFTTVMVWKPYKPTEYQGELYGNKDMEFPAFVGLPALTTQPLELAMGGGAPLSSQALTTLGWRCRRGLDISLDLKTYGDYISTSRGEWSIAKHGYVRTRSGWFGDRSASYLASGRPVVQQRTGFAETLPVGMGLFDFSTCEEAASAIDTINADYMTHMHAAREIAETHFDAEKVLPPLLETAMTQS